LRRLARECQVLGTHRYRRDGRLAVRLFEQPQLVLHAQHAAHGIVDQRERHQARFDQLRQVLGVRAGGHL
jgi:hypothetical protein